MRLADIGHQLKAFRLESGLKADEIAQRLGISRAALYRYEKGDVIKLDTVQRLAELLKVSPLSLLGIGVEYYQRQPAFFERLRQIEESADTILVVGESTCSLGMSDELSALLYERMRRLAALEGADPLLRAVCEATIDSLEARRAAFAARIPTVIAMVPIEEVQHMIQGGFHAGLPPDYAFETRCREVAHAEAERLASSLETPPLGTQVGLLRHGEYTGTFRLMRQRDRSMIAVNPFQATGLLSQGGVAIVTGASEAITPHHRVAELLWKHSIKGAEAAALVRNLLPPKVAAAAA